MDTCDSNTIWDVTELANQTIDCDGQGVATTIRLMYFPTKCH